MKRIVRGSVYVALAAAGFVASAPIVRTTAGPSTPTINGVVAGSYFTPPAGPTPSSTVASHYQGATVCMDANYSGVCDAGEEAAVTDDDGMFSLTTRRAGQLVAEIPATATNAGQPIGQRSIFRAAWDQIAAQTGAGEPVAVTPLTTEVVRMMEAGGLDFNTAMGNLATRLGVPIDAVLNDPDGVVNSQTKAALLTESVILTNRFAFAARMLDRHDVATVAAAQQAAMNLEDIPRYDNVFVIVLENKPTASIKNSPFAPKINAYLNAGNQFTSYYATGNPSEPNRLGITAADDFGIADDNSYGCTPGGASAVEDLPPPTGVNPCTQATNHNIKNRPTLPTALMAAGMTWRVYSESINPHRDVRANGIADATVMAHDHLYPAGSPVGAIGNPNLLIPFPSSLYAAKHNESLNFQNIRSAPEFLSSNRTMGGGQWDEALAARYPDWEVDQLGRDLASTDVAQLNYLEPDQCDDMHGTTVQGTVPPSTTKINASDCSGNANIYRGDLYTDYLIKKIQASSIWTNTQKRVAIVISFDEGSATSGLNACCGWNQSSGGSSSIPGKSLGPLVKQADGSVLVETTITNYNQGNKGHGSSVFGVITNQPAAPKAVVDSDAYSHFSFVRTLQDMFQLADPADDWSYMNRSKYTEKFIADNFMNLPEYPSTADAHFDSVRPMNHAYVIPDGYVQKNGFPTPQVGPDANQLNGWALAMPAPALPVSTALVAPAENSAGWNHTPVMVTLQASGSPASPATQSPAVQSIAYSLTGAQTGAQTVAGSSATFAVSGEGQTIVSYFAQDALGRLSAPRALAVNLDLTPPSIAGSLFPLANAAGWSNAPVTASFLCDDLLSGLASCAGSVAFGEGVGQSTIGVSTDVAGNTGTTTLSGINVDLTPPAISFSGNAGSYNVDQMISVTCNASDPLSGIASSTCPGANAPAYTFPLGQTTLHASATDRAGNEASGMTSFTVGVGFESLSRLTEQCVTQHGIANSLMSKLAAAARATARGDAAGKAGSLNAYANELSAQSGKALTAAQAALLAQLAGDL